MSCSAHDRSRIFNAGPARSCFHSFLSQNRVLGDRPVDLRKSPVHLAADPIPLPFPIDRFADTVHLIYPPICLGAHPHHAGPSQRRRVGGILVEVTQQLRQQTLFLRRGDGQNRQRREAFGQGRKGQFQRRGRPDPWRDQRRVQSLGQRCPGGGQVHCARQHHARFLPFVV